MWEDYLAHGPTGNRLPEFAWAGFGHGIPPPRLPAAIQVSTFGAKPDDGLDDTAAIQAAITAAEAQGGGVVELSAGQFDLNMGEDPGRYGLRISHGGVVLRGTGSGPGGTLLHQHRVALGIDGHDGLATALIRAKGPGTLGRTPVPVASDVQRGDREVAVASSAGFIPGMVVQLTLDDPALKPHDLHAADADLAAAFVAPFVLTDRHADYLQRGTNGSFLMLLEVESIPSPTRIRFRNALRMDLSTRWNPRLQVREVITGIGVESLSISCAWKGGFSHHKPFPWEAKGDYVKGGPGILRTAQEQDYSWSAIAFQDAAHAWIREVETRDYTQDVTLSYVRNATIDGLRIEGQAGHTGITLSRSFDCLVREVGIVAPRVHTFFVAGFSAGNVFTRSHFDYGPYDAASGCDTCLDFHGLSPYENLYDGISNAYVYPGGALGYLPHAGQRNVFWNVTAPARMLRGGDSTEFFRTYAPTSSGGRFTAYEHWPKAFLIGVHREGSPITVGGQDEDRADDWLTIQGLNRPGVQPESLYQAQRLQVLPSSTREP